MSANVPNFDFDDMAHRKSHNHMTREPGDPTARSAVSPELDHQLANTLKKMPSGLKDHFGKSDADFEAMTRKEAWDFLREMVADAKVGPIVSAAVMEAPIFVKDTVKTLSVVEDGQAIRITCPFTDVDPNVNSVLLHHSEIPPMIKAMQDAYDSMADKQDIYKDDSVERPDWYTEVDGEPAVTREAFRKDMLEVVETYRLVGASDEVIERLKQTVEDYIETGFGDRDTVSVDEMTEITMRLIEELNDES